MFFPRTTRGLECPDADTLAALLGDALSEGDRAEVANHAAACERCHVLIEGLVERSTDDGTSEPRRPATLELRRDTLVGRYLIGEQLGAGGMGLVYAAVDTELLRRVAVKLLRPDLRGPSDGGERMLREARTLARLSHPNVVTVFDVGTHEGHPFIAMELVDGGSLSDWVRGAPRKLEDRLERMLEAAKGLAAAHALGVVHRDVKPENILIGTDGHARMTDFGLARADDVIELGDDTNALVPDTSRLTRTGTLMGTPAYMAPEQLAREAIDPRSDQWSFCATLYEVIAGTRPFPVDDLVARTAAIRSGGLASPAPGRTAPAWVRQIVARGVREDPAERWPSMDAVVHALGRGQRRRRRLWIGGLAIVPAGIAVALALHLATSTPAPPPSKDPQRWVDARSGCNCPYSACDGKCASVCRASAFPIETPVPGVNGKRSQEALLGASGDGDTLLYLTGTRCALDRLMLARRHGATFDTFDLTNQLDPSVKIAEGCCTLAPDGGSVLLATQDHRGFVRWLLRGTQLVRAGDAELLDLLPPRANGGTVRFPVLSNDGLTLYYRFNDDGHDEVPDGPYAAVRADVRAPFHPGRRLGGRAPLFEYVSGVSSDGLSLFMASEFETRVLVRTSTALPFGDPAYTLEPARMRGWRAIPLEDCRRIVTTTTPGGCESEDIVWLDAAN